MERSMTEIDRNHRFRLFQVTEIIRSPYRGPVVFGGSVRLGELKCK